MSGLPASADRQALLEQVTILTVTYNSGHCIAPLAQGLREAPHLVVVDNASADDTCELVPRLLPGARLLRLERNLGYGVANNAGIEQSATPYVLLLNPDCEVTLDQVAELVRSARQWPDAAIWVPQLTDGRGQLEVNYSWPRDAWAPRTGAADGPLNVGYACAAVMLLDRERMARVGFFDPRFFLYYEDEDLCLRAFKAREPILVLPHIQVIHFSRGSVKGPRPLAAEYWRGWHHAQSKIIFTRKHFGEAAGRRLLRRTLLRSWAQLAVRLVLLSPRLFARALGRHRGLRQLARSMSVA